MTTILIVGISVIKKSLPDFSTTGSKCPNMKKEKGVRVPRYKATLF
jgi:hypothetical protein